MGYRHSVNDIAATCLQEAISEAKATDLYQIKGGAVSFTVLFWVDIIMIPSHSTSFFPLQTVITDCRHDSTSNAYHSTVVMISYE